MRMLDEYERNLIKINFNSMGDKKASKYKEILNEIKLLNSINYENEEKKEILFHINFFNGVLYFIIQIIHLI